MRSLTYISLPIYTILLFQNCAKVNFERADFGSKITPQCRDMKAAEVSPKLKWDWHKQLDSNVDLYYGFDQVMASPMVADLDGDKIPEVLFVTFTTYPILWFDDALTDAPLHAKNGVLRVVDGRNGKTKYSVGGEDLSPMGDTEPLVIDIDGDGKSEIFYYDYKVRQGGGSLIALNYDGSLRWKFPVAKVNCNRGVSASDYDKNGVAEIILSSQIVTEVNRKPELVSTFPDVGCHALAYVDKGEAKIFKNSGVYNFTGEKIFPLSQGAFISMADIDQDGSQTELITSSGGRIDIWDSTTGASKKVINLNQYTELFCPGKASVGGGPVSIGNFDSNKETLEFAVATGRNLTIFKSDGTLLTKSETQDCSSLSTGLTTFDFNGDQTPEIIYSDEEYLRIYQITNQNLEVVFQTPNPSGTLHEYPVIADIDGNGSSELLVVANNYTAGGFYRDPEESDDKEIAKTITGVRAFESAADQAWMKSRPIWNQYYFSPQFTTDLLRPNTNYGILNSFLRNFESSKFESKCVNK